MDFETLLVLEYEPHLGHWLVLDEELSLVNLVCFGRLLVLFWLFW